MSRQMSEEQLARRRKRYAELRDGTGAPRRTTRPKAQSEEERKARRNQDAKAYRLRNPEKVSETNRAWREQNPRYHYKAEYRRKNREELNRKAREGASRRKAIRRSIGGSRTGPWSEAEIAIVSRSDITLTEMAYMLDRSYDSITGKRYNLRQKGLIS